MVLRAPQQHSLTAGEVIITIGCYLAATVSNRTLAVRCEPHKAMTNTQVDYSPNLMMEWESEER